MFFRTWKYLGVKMNFDLNFNRSTLTLTLRRKKFKFKWSGTPNNGFCPNVTFEDVEFKEDNKALNDQGKCENELMLFCLP
jgi:hypothetical protein